MTVVGVGLRPAVVDVVDDDGEPLGSLLITPGPGGTVEVAEPDWRVVVADPEPLGTVAIALWPWEWNGIDDVITV